MTYYTFFESPIGPLLLLSNGVSLTGLWMRDPTPPADVERDDVSAPFMATQTQLKEYFAGERRAFDLPIDLGGSPFQRTVWAALCEIPYGVTRSYGEIARRIGSPTASRAVGLANGQNPISIIVPCHRVIGANGNLTGYGGGVENKKALLALEGATLF